MTVEQVIDDINLRGLLVNNLFQRDDGTWQANVRGPDCFSQFGRGATPAAALQDALRRCPHRDDVKDLLT